MPGTLFVVATPIGNLEDITLRALRVLREVGVIAAEDTRRTAQLLARHGIATPTTSLHEHNEHRKAATLVARLTGGESVAVVSDAGTPTISDPGRLLVRAAREAGIRVEPVPGPSAVTAALSVSGFSADTFTFLGFPPTRSNDRQKWFERALRIGGVVVFYEAPHRIRRTLRELTELIGETPVFVGREITKAHEEFVERPINELSDELLPARGEFTIVVDLGDTREIGQSGEIVAATRRQKVTLLAEQLGLPANELYRALELMKSMG